MLKRILISTLSVAGLAYFWYHSKQEAIKKSIPYLKNNFSIRIPSFQVIKVDKSGVDMRLTTEFINTSNMEARAEALQLDVYYIKNNVESFIASQKVPASFSIKGQDTTVIPNIQVKAGIGAALLFNLSFITALVKTFKVVASCKINGQLVTYSKTITVNA